MAELRNTRAEQEQYLAQIAREANVMKASINDKVSARESQSRALGPLCFRETELLSTVSGDPLSLQQQDLGRLLSAQNQLLSALV